MSGHRGYVLEAHGFVETATPADPAVATDLVWAIPLEPGGGSDVQVLIECLSFSFLTVGVNRLVAVSLLSGANNFYTGAPGLVQPAGTDIYSAGRGLQSHRLGNYQSIPLPSCLLGPGHVVRTQILNIAGADQVTDVVIRYRWWRLV